MFTVPTLAQATLGRNTISSPQMRTYDAFLSHEHADNPFHDALALLTADEVASVAKFGYSALGPAGKALDIAFCVCWDAWVATLPVAPPKSHMWIKGLLAAALIREYEASIA